MISEGFELLKLPKVSSKVSVVPPYATNDARIYLGLSHGSLTTLSLKPPRVEDAHSVSPSTVITAVAAGSQLQVAYASVERRKHFVHLLKGGMAQLKASAAGLYFSGNLLLVLYDDLTVEAFSADDLESQWTASLREDNFASQASVAFTSQVSPDVQLVVVANEGEFICVLMSGSEDGLKILGSFAAGSGDKGTSIFASDGAVLYQYSSESATIYLHTITEGALLLSFQVGGDAPSEILALAHRNLLLRQGDKLVLLDTTYQSRIAERTVDSIDGLIAYSPVAQTAIASVGGEVVGYHITPSSGMLIESIGRNATLDSVSAGHKSNKFGYADIFSSFNGAIKELQRTSVSRTELAEKEAHTVLQALQAAHASSSGEAFSRLLVYLKTKNAWKATPATVAEEVVIFEDTDREVDKDLLKEAAEIVFGVTERGVGKVAKFIPTNLPIYLLTHPLFPVGEYSFRNLFTALESEPLLYRQAIVTLPGVSSKELLAGLFSADEEILSDAVQRLVDEFSYEQIYATIKESFGGSNKNGGLSKLVIRLSKHENAWPLIAPFMDAMNFLSWDAEVLGKLQRRLNKSVESTRIITSLDVIVSETLRNAQFDKPSSDGKKHRKNQNAGKPEKTGIPHVPLYSVETLQF